MYGRVHSCTGEQLIVQGDELVSHSAGIQLCHARFEDPVRNHSTLRKIKKQKWEISVGTQWITQFDNLCIIEGCECFGETLDLLQPLVLDLRLDELSEGVVGVSNDQTQQKALSQVDRGEEDQQVGQVAKYLLR